MSKNDNDLKKKNFEIIKVERPVTTIYYYSKLEIDIKSYVYQYIIYLAFKIVWYKSNIKIKPLVIPIYD